MSGKNWANQKLGNFSQENNATEKLLGKLESCGPTALACIIEDLGYADMRKVGVHKMEVPFLQIEDFYTMVLNSDNLIRSNDGYPANRYILNYRQLINLLYPGVFEVTEVWYPHDEFPSDIANLVAEYLKRPNTELLLVMRNPGHYVAAQHVENGVLYYADPWTKNPYNSSTLVKRSIKLTKIAENLKIGFVAITLRGL